MQSESYEGGIIPSSSMLLDQPIGYEAGDYLFDGRFYQTVDEAEYQRRQTAIDTHLANRNVANMGLALYQQWTELDWKKPHGTYEAVLRWKDKLEEEAIDETPHALYEFAASNNVDAAQLKQAAIEELGDTLWTTCALVSNAGQSLDKALQSYLWGDGLISPREDSLSFGHIDQIVADIDNTPWFSPLDALDPLENNIAHIKLDEMEPRKNLFFRSKTLLILSEKQFGHGENDGFFLDWHRKIGEEEIAPVAAAMVMTVAWYAQHFADSSLAEVVESNILKLRPRVAANLIDKIDGDRSQL